MTRTGHRATSTTAACTGDRAGLIREPIVTYDSEYRNPLAGLCLCTDSKGNHNMGFSKWAKQARTLANQHSDKINAGIDKAAKTAKTSQPSKSTYIDKAADAVKKSVNKP